MSRIARLLVVVAVVALAAPGSASAHLRTGTTAVDYIASVSSASSAAFTVGVYSSDLALHLATHGEHKVVVIGYLGEPFLRIGPRGTAVDTASPTAAASGLLKNLPAPAAHRGRWRLIPGRRSAVWHDARVSALAHGSRSGAWDVPLLVDAHRARIRGRTYRFDPPRLWFWLVLLVPFPVLVLMLRARARDRLDRFCILFGAVAAAAALVLSGGFALDSYASAGTWIAAADEAVFLVAAAAAAIWAPPRFRAVGGAALGLVALAVGLSEGAIFLHAIVLSRLPGTLSRALALTTVAVGTSAVGLGPFHLLGDVFPSPGASRRSIG